MLKGDVAKFVRTKMNQILNENDVKLINGAINEDHIHLLVSLKPSLSISVLVQLLKGSTSNALFKEFPILRQKYWGQHF
jgi:putative transposase